MNKKSLSLIIVVISIILAAGAFYLLQPQNPSSSTTDNNPTSGQIVIQDKTDELREESQQMTAYKDIETEDAYKLITEEKPGTIVIDVSPKFEEGHLPGAINFYIGDDSLEEAIPSLDKEKTYLIYCHVDNAAIAGAEALSLAGFRNVYRLVGNYSTWRDKGYPIEIELSATGSYSGSALATRSYLKGTFKHTVTADIAPPSDGKFYEGWLVKGSAFFSTGKLQESTNGTYTLEYSATKDSRDYQTVVITEETSANGLDNKPETHILEGEFI